MTVLSILSEKGREVATIAPERTMAEAASLLSERRIGALVVTGPARDVAGILSERDIVHAIARQGASALGEPVSRFMTARVQTCREDTTIDAVMELMTAGKFRHMPVVDNGRLCGIVSIGDIVKRRVAEIEAEHRALRDYIAMA
jgi:CBS domain-containing protein